MSRMPNLLHSAAAAGFSAGVEDYERGRPDYPAPAIAWLAESLRLGPGVRLPDLAAGT